MVNLSYEKDTRIYKMYNSSFLHFLIFDSHISFQKWQYDFYAIENILFHIFRNSFNLYTIDGLLKKNDFLPLNFIVNELFFMNHPLFRFHHLKCPLMIRKFQDNLSALSPKRETTLRQQARFIPNITKKRVVSTNKNPLVFKPVT